MDQKVLMTQKWLNNTYRDKAGYISCVEDGATGNGTVTSLIAALQIELNIDYITGEFGPMTAEACPTLKKGATGNIVNILQGALWCKGFSSDDLTGKFENSTVSGVNLFKSAAGLGADGTVDAKTFKGILSTDAVVLIDGGDSKIRQIQVALNSKYSDYFWKDLNICPCDGYYGRNTCNALLYAFQKEVGIDEPNGVFGPGTAQGAGDHNVALGSKQTALVYLLQYMLYVNGFDPGNFDGEFDLEVQSAVMDFQALMALDSDGWVGLSTWAALLVSKGNTDRDYNAIDCTDRITYERAKYLKSIGINYIGRYLTGYWKVSKNEINNMNLADIRFIPIFERSGADIVNTPDVTDIEYFTRSQGISDGQYAKLGAELLGLPKNSTIYFAVDFDVYDYEVESNIIPYFKGVNQGIGSYNVGVYAPRYACTALYNAGLTTTSYVSDMSVGFSGNIGQRIPDNWAFDQFDSTHVGSGNTYMGIDKLNVSGRYLGAYIPISDIKREICDEMLRGFNAGSLTSTWDWNQEVILPGPYMYIKYKCGLEGQFTPMFNTSSVPSNQTTTFFIENGVFDSVSLDILENAYKGFSSEIKTALGNDGNFSSAVSVANTIGNGTMTVSFQFNNGYPTIDFQIKQIIHTSDTNEEAVYFEICFMAIPNALVPEPGLEENLKKTLVLAGSILTIALICNLGLAGVAASSSFWGNLSSGLVGI